MPVMTCSGDPSDRLHFHVLTWGGGRGLQLDQLHDVNGEIRDNASASDDNGDGIHPLFIPEAEAKKAS